MPAAGSLGDRLAALHSISVEIAALHDLTQVEDRALGHGMRLTSSELAFTGLMVDGPRIMEVGAIKGFEPASPEVYEQFHLMAVTSSAVGAVIKERRPYLSNRVTRDGNPVTPPPGHPPIRSFLGVPLVVGETLIGMIGVANKRTAYRVDDQILLSTIANQVAVAIESARLHARQQEMIATLDKVHQSLGEARRERQRARDLERIARRVQERMDRQIVTIGLRLNALLEDRALPAAAAEGLESIRKLTLQAAQDARQAIFDLTDIRDGEGDLAGDLRSLLRDWERTSGLQAHLVVSGWPDARVDQVRDVATLVLSEALTNVVKHARARMVLVSLRYERGRVELVVQDDGVGISESLLRDYPGSHLHFGLRNARETVVGRGGTFEVSNGEQAGLTVKATLALAAAD